MAFLKNLLMTLASLQYILLMVCNGIVGLTVDNQLVSARNDCFERIALEAMLPFEKTFRTEDTNSLKMCKDKCIQAGEKCQAMSFGVHRRGNGTCQLSTEKYGSSKGRPSGVIFDPDFDLYSRKTNCFDLSDNTIPMQDGVSSVDDAYAGLSPTPSLPSRPSDDLPILLVNPTPSTSSTFDDRPLTPTGGYGTTLQNLPEDPGSTLVPSTPNGDRLFFTHDIYPLYKYPMLYEHNYPAPNEDVYIPGGYASNIPVVDDRYRPGYPMDDHIHPTPHGPPRPIFGLGYGNGYSYGKPERYNPTTLRPYDQNGPTFSPLPNGRPEVDRDEQGYVTRPGSYANERPDMPISYGSESHLNERPDRPQSYPNDRPERPGPYPNDRPVGPNNRPSRPEYASTPSYHPRPEYETPNPSNRPPHEIRPTTPTMNGGRPGDFVDFTNRPDPPQEGYGGSSSRPPMHERDPNYFGPAQPSDPNRYDYVRRNGTAARPDGMNYNDDKTIATYFNPDDYLPGNNKKRPDRYGDQDRVGYPMNPMKGK